MTSGQGLPPSEGLSALARVKGLSAHDLTLIRKVALLRGLDGGALVRLLEPAALVVAPKGATLFTQDTPADRFHVLLSGWVKLYRVSPEGEEAVVGVVAPGESFAEAAMFSSGRYPVGAEAVDRSRLLAFARSDLMRIMEEDSSVALAMLASLSVRLRGLVGMIEQLQARSAPKRAGAFFLRLAPDGAEGAVTVALPFDKGLIAKRLGMRAETFSRALRRLREIGVSAEGGVIAIGDVGALRDYCEGPAGD